MTDIAHTQARIIRPSWHTLLAHPVVDDPLHPVTEEQARRAALRVCENAQTPDEARELLDMLGLRP